MTDRTSARSRASVTAPIPTTARPAFRQETARGRYGAITDHRIFFPISVFLIHFLIVQLTATLAYVDGTPRASSGPFETSLGPPVPMTGFWANLVGPLRLWDGLWYKLIADRGYGFSEYTTAFWPLLPWVMRYGHQWTGLPSEVIGYLFANLCFLGALIVLYELLRLDVRPVLARRALWCLALFPTSLFFTAVYTEAPFLLFAAAALLCARRGQWLFAGLAGLLAALTRSQGIMLLLPFAVLFLQQRRFDLRRWLPDGVFAALPVLGPAIYAQRLIDYSYPWRAFIDVQAEWNRTSATPWTTFKCALQGCTLKLTNSQGTFNLEAHHANWSWVRQFVDTPSWQLLTSEPFRTKVANSDTLEAVMTFLFLGLAVIVLAKLPLWQSAYVWPPLIVPLFQPSTVHPLMSIPRFGLVLFPLFVALAMLLRWRWLQIPAAIVSVALLVLLTIQFSQWYWVS